MIVFDRTIGKGEVKSTYFNLTDDEGNQFGTKLGLYHKEKLIIIDALGRRTRAQMHHENQIWGSLQQWYEGNHIEPGDVIEVRFDPNESEDGLRVIRLIQKQVKFQVEPHTLEESYPDALFEKDLKAREGHGTVIHDVHLKNESIINSTKVFNAIIRELRMLLHDAQDQGSQAFKDENFDKVKFAAEYGKEVLAIIERVEALQESWLLHIESKIESKKRQKRLSPGA